MIRLVASDIDGTLLMDGIMELSDETIAAIRGLTARGIAFCAASGRQYTSLRRLFAPVADDIYYICENGAVVYGPGPEGPFLDKTPMDRALAEALAEDIRAREDCEVLISGANTSYLVPKDPALPGYISHFLGRNIIVLPRISDVPEDIIKVAAYCTPSPAAAQAVLKPKWEKHFNVAVSGPRWVDFTRADKGVGIRALCRVTGIAPEEIMAFGDNFNDIAMLDAVGHPVLMENAHPALKERYNDRCANVAQRIRQELLL